jgi:uncharacterized protein (TIGR02453 family)
MDNAIDLQPVLEFLSQLEENNNRGWFEERRSAYQLAKTQFEHLVNQVIEDFREIEDWGDLTAKNCVMRIHRDVRFSKDKSPYRTHMAAAFAAGGKQSIRMPYYLQIAPREQSFLAGGLYMPSAGQLAQFRKIIDHNPKPFKAVINHKTFQQLFGGLSGESLKIAPQGYPKDHPKIALLRYKQVIASHPLSDATVLAADFPAQIVTSFARLKPFLDDLNAAVAHLDERLLKNAK